MFEDLFEELKNKELIKDKNKIISELSVLLKKVITQKEKVAIAFSAGVDSSLLALFNPSSTLYTIGLENSTDLEEAKKLAAIMKWNLKYKLISLEEAERIIKEVVKILKTDDPVNVGIGCVVYAVLEMAKKDNFDIVLGGLGAEEIFAGYERHRKDLTKIHEECWKGLFKLEKGDLARDLPIAKYFNIDLRAPFLDRELVKSSMLISPELKANKQEKKIILREIALSLGIPKEFSFRKKIAAQYGSKFDRAILRLAKRKGFKLRRDYLKSLIDT